MNDHNNRLFHPMGPKNILWIHEKDLKNYSDPNTLNTMMVEEGIEFLSQHHIHRAWIHGKFVRRNGQIKIQWTQVIVIKGDYK